MYNESPLRITFRDEVTPANDDTGDWMPLPATKEQLQQELTRTNTDNRMAGRIQPTDIASPYNWLSDVLTDEADINELNLLAMKISELDGDGIDKLEAVIESGRHRGSNGIGSGDIADLINIAQNLDSFTFYPDFDEQNYGEHLLSGHGNVVDRLIRQLQSSPRSEDEEFGQYVEALRESADAEQFGKSMSCNNDGEFLDVGYLIENGNFEAEYYGVQNIPVEYRIWEPSETFIKVVNVDLLPLLLEMHALGGNYTQDAARNYQALIGGDCFITVSSEKLTVLPAADVFHMDSPYYNEFTGACNGDARVFFVDVNVDVNAAGFYGSIQEIGTDVLMEEIHNLSFDSVNIDAEFKDGTNRVFTPTEWSRLSDAERSQVAGMVKRYDTASESRVNDFIHNLRDNIAIEGHTITQEDFLANLNAPFMARAQNQQAGMLRIAREAANIMVARSDAEVYRLLPEGALKLSPMDVVKSNGLWFPEHREFAIKPGGLAGLRKWANRTVDDIARQFLHKAINKSRDNEH